MNALPSDALVLFGVTGDLAGKMLLPAIDALLARGSLDIPVIGVARQGAPIAERVRDSIARDGVRDGAAGAWLACRLRYVEGDLPDPATFAEIRRSLAGAKRPLLYCAIPPSAFGGVARLLAQAGLAERARVAVEKPFGHDLESARELESAARVAALAAIAPVSPQLIVRGQYAGYREIEGVARESQTEIFIALRLDVDTPRWRGVPFCLRAGKRLPLTTTKAFARYGPPAGAGCASHVRIRIGPGAVGVGLGSLQRSREDAARELRTDLGRDEDRDAYVSLLDAALRGDSSYAERADGVPAAWRAVEPALRTSLPVHRYSGGSWGPAEADRVPPLGERWHELAPVD